MSLGLGLQGGAGCTTVKYLWQAGRGQLELSNRARPIAEVLLDAHVDPRVRRLLAEIPAIKSFGEAHGLKATQNYVSYADLHRPAAVWVVSASDPLQFVAKQWSFPVVGSFPYIGWFDRAAADEFAEGLRRDGYDADVRGASAFSTLGWFRDPVLSTMIAEGPEARGELVNVVLHESTHATFYVEGQSYFDESIAEFVAERLTEAYFAEHARTPQDRAEARAYAEGSREGERRGGRLHAAYAELSALYASAATEDAKRARKAEVYARLRRELALSRDINNATLIQYKTYNVGEAEFRAIYAHCGADFPRFWRKIRTLTAASFARPQADELTGTLGPLTRGDCP